MTVFSYVVISLQDEETVQSLFTTWSNPWGSSNATGVAVGRKGRQDALLSPPAVLPVPREVLRPQWLYLIDSSMRKENNFFPTSMFWLFRPNVEQRFCLRQLNPKAQSEIQTQVVSLQSAKLFLWLTMPMLMKYYRIGLQNFKYSEWDANSSHWFLFPRYGKPLLLTKTVPRLGGEEFFNVSFFLH